MRDSEFERLFEEHAQGVFGYLAYRVGDRQVAQDLVADTFERILRSRRRFDPRRGSAKTWLYAIALNVLRDHQRRSAAERRALDRAGVAPEPAGGTSMEDDVGARDYVARGLAALSDDERQALALRYGADLTVPEIACLTGERHTTVEGRVYRALRKLREAAE